jgi:hypothetical protein
MYLILLPSPSTMHLPYFGHICVFLEMAWFFKNLNKNLGHNLGPIHKVYVSEI